MNNRLLDCMVSVSLPLRLVLKVVKGLPSQSGISQPLALSSRAHASKMARQPLTLARFGCGLLAVVGLFCVSADAFGQTQLPMTNSTPAFQVLVFSKTTGYRHPAIANGISAIRTLGALNNFSVVATEDANVFTDAQLASYKAVVFLLTTGDLFTSAQKAAFTRYIQAGNGFVGIHSVADTEYNWSWYGGLMGAYYSSHPPIAAAVIHVEDTNHVSTAFLPATWIRTDEWFNYRANPRAQVHVLLSLDESSYFGGTMGDHPIAWCHEYDGGRAWFTGLGHEGATYADPWFRRHLLGGIQYAAGVPLSPPANARMLFDGTNTTEWVQSSNGNPARWPVVGGALQSNPTFGNIQTVEYYHDLRLHVEFLLHGSAPGTGEGQLANSGIYLQNRYEIQIMETYGRPISGYNESGAIYGVRDPKVNASVPYERWEIFDLIFQAARWSGTTKTSNARLSLYWNDVLVQDNVSIAGSTGAGVAERPTAGPIVLQALVGSVRFRNIWVVGVLANPPTLTWERIHNSLVISWPAVPSGFRLESSPQIGSPAVWAPVSYSANILSSQIVVTQDTAASGSFYRLIR
jgi:type 1 glutamine amidotransferase